MRKPYDDLDLIVGGRYGPRPITPTSPITAGNWGLDNYSNLDGVNPTFMHIQQPHSRLGALDLESKKLPSHLTQINDYLVACPIFRVCSFKKRKCHFIEIKNKNFPLFCPFK